MSLASTRGARVCHACVKRAAQGSMTLPRKLSTRATTISAAIDHLTIRSASTLTLHTKSRIAARSYATMTAPAEEVVIPDIPPSDTYDIVIIGGGNAGLALTCALLSKPSIRDTSRILLLEGGSLDRVRGWDDKAEWDNRVSSLTAENVDWLKNIGVWKHIARKRSCPVEEMIIYSNPSSKSTPSIHFPPLGHPMAHMTENVNLQRALLRRIEEVGKGVVDIREGGKVGDMQLGEGGRWVGLNVGDKGWVKGSVVVGADGPNSPVRRFSEIETYLRPYPTHAVVATLHHPVQLYPNNTAFQRFLPTGPLAFLPLSPTSSTMVWSTTPQLAAAYKKLDTDALTSLVNVGFSMHEEYLNPLNDIILDNTATSGSSNLSAKDINHYIRTANPDGNTSLTPDQATLPPVITSISPSSIASFPLRLSHATTYTNPSKRTILVGDAAHTIHPLAGQGLNMGLADVQSLANTWEKTRITGGDLGAGVELRGYTRERYAKNQAMLIMTDGLNLVFGKRGGVVDWVRGTGLEVINELEGVKRILMGGAGAKVRGGERGVGGGKVGWGSSAAKGLEGWIGFKGAVGGVLGLAGEVAKNGLRSAVNAMDRK